MAKREFLQLAHTYSKKRTCSAGYFVSEKLDGMRCYWDGGISRGIPKSQVPWANTAKDYRLATKHISTGLWSRYGNVIHAPDWWLDDLPQVPLDGELYNPHMLRQHIMSIIKKFAANCDDSDWENIGYYCYDRPSYETIFADGKINNTNFKKTFKGIQSWIAAHMTDDIIQPRAKAPFESTYIMLQRHLVDCIYALAHKQEVLPWSTEEAEKILNEKLERVSEAGGEGLMIRSPAHPYECERSHHVLKIKHIEDAEGTVIGYTTGRETDKGSKLLGLMGAMIVEANYACHNADGTTDKIQFELSGFTDAERVLGECDDKLFPDGGARTWAEQNPGRKCPDWITNLNFPRGTQVTFTYRGVTDDGIPQEARYYRKREDI